VYNDTTYSPIRRRSWKTKTKETGKNQKKKYSIIDEPNDSESDDWIDSSQIQHPPQPPPQVLQKESEILDESMNASIQQSAIPGSYIDKSLTEAKTNLNAFGKAGEYLETHVRGWYSWLGWTPNVNASDDTNGEADDSRKDIVVIHTNWFWKQQIRLLRFTQKQFMRTHPVTKEVKEVHQYTQVDKITITGNTFMIIYFLPSLSISPEYYESKERDLIVELITTRAQAQGRNVSLIEVFEKD